MTSTLIAPIVTEKSMKEVSLGRYSFAVAKDATKPQIRQAVEDAFKVKVVRVQTITVPEKTKRSGRLRKVSRQEAWKKAIVALESSQKIDLFSTTEGVSAK